MQDSFRIRIVRKFALTAPYHHMEFTNCRIVFIKFVYEPKSLQHTFFLTTVAV